MFNQIKGYIKMRYEQFIINEVDRLKLNDLTFSTNTLELEEKCDKLEEEINYLEQDVEHLTYYKERCEELEYEIHELETENDHLNYHLIDLKERYDKAIDELYSND